MWKMATSQFLLISLSAKALLPAKDFTALDILFGFLSKSLSNSATTVQSENQASILSQVAEDLEDEGVVSISIEDFSGDDN